MSKLERLKIEAAFFEKLFFAALAIDAAVIGWAVEHRRAAEPWLLALCFVAVLSVSAFAAHCRQVFKQLLEELENE